MLYIFDLGNVIVDIDFNRVLGAWSDLTRIPLASLKKSFHMGEAFHQHERGEISDEAFAEALCHEMALPLSYEQFSHGWQAVFVALTIRHGSGIVCLCITEDRRKQLDLPMMVENNTSAYGTGFTVTIEAAEGVTTGVSAADRITTVRAAIADGAKPSDLNRPGHVFPLRAQAGGVLTRGGHTEATIDLMTLAGFKPAGVLCELTNDDGTMARAPECIEFANKHNMALVTIEDLVAYRQAHERKAS